MGVWGREGLISSIFVGLCGISSYLHLPMHIGYPAAGVITGLFTMFLEPPIERKGRYLFLLILAAATLSAIIYFAIPYLPADAFK